MNIKLIIKFIHHKIIQLFQLFYLFDFQDLTNMKFDFLKYLIAFPTNKFKLLHT